MPESDVFLSAVCRQPARVPSGRVTPSQSTAGQGRAGGGVEWKGRARLGLDAVLHF